MEAKISWKFWKYLTIFAKFFKTNFQMHSQKFSVQINRFWQKDGWFHIILARKISANTESGTVGPVKQFFFVPPFFHHLMGDSI